MTDDRPTTCPTCGRPLGPGACRLVWGGQGLGIPPERYWVIDCVTRREAVS